MKTLYKDQPPKSAITINGDDFAGIIGELDILKRVPLNLLLPDPDALPAESIRFFYVDENFISALKDGALSIGRRVKADAVLFSDDSSRVRTGFIMRSKIVKTYADMQVIPKDSAGKALNVLRQDMLTGEILICLFDGEAASVTFIEPEHTRCFGYVVGGEKPITRDDGVLDIGKMNIFNSVDFANKFLMQNETAMLYFGENK